ncbi:hypothetical protein V6O07_11965, partial [Arthrospira platensis SPKY2]
AGADVSSVQSIRYVKAKTHKESSKTFEPCKKLHEKAKPACAKGARAGVSNQFDPDLQPVSRGVAKLSLPEVKESVLKGRAISNRRIVLKFERSMFERRVGWFPSAKEDVAVVNKMIEMKADGVVKSWSDFITMENPYDHKHYKSVWDKWCKYVL